MSLRNDLPFRQSDIGDAYDIEDYDIEDSRCPYCGHWPEECWCDELEPEREERDHADLFDYGIPKD